MSLKAMTPEQLRADLAWIANTWPEGVPTEQVDRVNAIKNELKRRGEDPLPAQRAVPRRNGSQPVESMTGEQLGDELRKTAELINQDPNDDSLQERFASIRYEIRRRQKAAAEAPAPKPEPEIVTKRMIEIPEGDVVTSAQPAVQQTPEPPASVKGWNASVMGGAVLINHAAKTSQTSLVQISSAMTVSEAEAFVAMVQAAIVKAKAVA